jgi:DNA-binding transcriptional LysR family regulator
MSSGGHRVPGPELTELRHMRSLVALSEELHFGRAARRLRIAQPALSQQIRRLEASVGVELFQRDSRSVQMTAAGSALLAEARLALAAAALEATAGRRSVAGLA